MKPTYGCLQSAFVAVNLALVSLLGLLAMAGWGATYGSGEGLAGVALVVERNATVSRIGGVVELDLEIFGIGVILHHGLDQKEGQISSELVGHVPDLPALDLPAGAPTGALELQRVKLITGGTILEMHHGFELILTGPESDECSFHGAPDLEA